MIAQAPSGGLPQAYARWRASRLGAITDTLERRLLVDMLGHLAGRHVLDVGCGDGALAAALLPGGAVVTGIDLDAAMLAAARRRWEGASLHLVQGRAEALPFAEGTFDRVLAVTLLCFVGEAERAVAEMARVLRPGGRLVVGELGRFSLWAAQRRVRGWRGDPVWHAATFRTAGDLARLVQAAGLDVSETRGGVYYPPCAAAARLLAPLDRWLGRRFTFGAAFIAAAATKPTDGRMSPAAP
jgi:SAM-dependent methyltransferase